MPIFDYKFAVYGFFAEHKSVTQSATAFGFSRPTYYQAETDFQRDGLFGLLPEKRGPRQGHKLTSEVLDFAMQLRTSDPSLRPLDLAAAIQERFVINVHPRSIERALRRQEKKRR
jgi:transposase